MRKLMIILGIGWIIGLLNIQTADAQYVSVNINLDDQPAWGPAGYDYVEYYYIPELNIYFDVENELFYYVRHRRWVVSPYLPARYARYDFYSLYKVVLNGIPDPWRYNRRHRRMYARYYRNYTQRPIFYVDDYRYDRARYNVCAWVEPRYMENHVYYDNVEMRNRRNPDWQGSSEYDRSVNHRFSDSRSSSSARASESVSSRSDRSSRGSDDVSSDRSSSWSRSSRSSDMSDGSNSRRSTDASSGGRSRGSEGDFSTNTRSSRSRTSNDASVSRSSSDNSRSSEARSSSSERNRSGRSSSRGRR